MKVVLNTVVFAVIAVASATMALAQPPGHGGPGGPGGQRGGPHGGGNDPGRAVLMALDTDGDHEISSSEISNAPAALLELDSNGDGKLSDSDLGNGGGRKGGGRKGGGKRGNQNAEGAGSDHRNGPPGHAGGPPEPAQMVQHAMQFDADGDGKLDATELLSFAEQAGPRGGGRGRGRGQGGGEGGSDSRPSRPSR